ncbi:Tdrd12p [Desmophyllum pertusum]|uniref:Tdrd12p n=1 Tax=Desmophyllum pertusum TaxID=174260 RepID=A0A9W9Z3W4_9CNID|nr:Tdrd12p [Desmophyllum pertusum]
MDATQAGRLPVFDLANNYLNIIMFSFLNAHCSSWIDLKKDDQVKKAEIVKEVQSIVLNSERSKDDIRDCGGIQALCRLLSLNRDPLVLQHILASLASLSFENESNCDEVRKPRWTSNRVLSFRKGTIISTEDSAVQESIAWALKNLAATERNQNEARIRGGIKALCELLRTASDDKVQERVTWAIGSLVKDHISNCQAVQECGGLKTLCDLVSQTHSENVLERTTWALGMLAIDLNNRNLIRQYGGIENICKKLQESPSQQIIKQGALTLKTLASNNQFNKDVMSRLGLIGTLRSFMTDEPQRLGIIARRVCWDLLQRLLGSAAGNFQTSITPPVPAPVSRTQACSTSPGSVKKNETEARLVNGVKDDNDGDDLPPLGGEDSDKENESAKSVNATPPANAYAKVATRENVSQQVTRRNVNASARPTNHPRPSAAEEENVVPFSVHPRTVWSQTRELVRVNVKLRGVERQQTEITASRLRFRTQMGHSLYELDLELFEDIDSEKRNHAVWTRLLKSKDKLPYVSIDFDRWEVWSSSEEDEGEGADNAPNAQAAAAPTNPNNSRRSSEDKGERRQVLLPEMIVSGSESDEESMASDVDCFNFHH